MHMHLITELIDFRTENRDIYIDLEPALFRLSWVVVLQLEANSIFACRI